MFQKHRQQCDLFFKFDDLKHIRNQMMKFFYFIDQLIFDTLLIFEEVKKKIIITLGLLQFQMNRSPLSAFKKKQDV